MLAIEPAPGEAEQAHLRNPDYLPYRPKTFVTLHQSYHLPGQFTPEAYGSSRPYRLIGEPELAEPLDSAARDCDFTEFFVSDVRLAAMLGPETASNNPAAIATMWTLAIVILVANVDLSAGVLHQDGEKRCALFATSVESFVRYRLYRLVLNTPFKTWRRR